MPAAARSVFTHPLVMAGLGLALLPFVALIGFAQPALDDYHNAATVEWMGRWGAQWFWYKHWSGRFVAIGFSTVLNPLSYGPRHGVEPAGLWVLRSLLLLLAGAFVVVVQQVFRALQLVLTGPAPVPACRSWACALAVTVLGFNALPEPFTLLYWYSGAVNYMLPLVAALAFAAASLRTLRLPPGGPGRRRWMLAATLGLVGAVGGSEIAMLWCWVLLAGMGAWVWNSNSRPPGTQLVWVVWLVAGLVATGLMVGAPGNWERLAMATPDAAGHSHRWVLLVPRTLLTAARMAARPPVLGALLALVTAVLIMPVGPSQPRPSRGHLLLALGGYVLLNCAGVAFLKAAFMHDMWVEAMPGRVVNVLVLQLLVSTTALALWVRSWLPGGPAWWRHRTAVPLLTVLTALLLLTGQARRAGQELLFTAPAYRQQMQARYEALAAARQQGRAEAVLPPLRLPAATGLLVPIPSARQQTDVNVELFEDAAHRNNRLLAHYYGLSRVRLSGPVPTRHR